MMNKPRNGFRKIVVDGKIYYWSRYYIRKEKGKTIHHGFCFYRPKEASMYIKLNPDLLEMPIFLYDNYPLKITYEDAFYEYNKNKNKRNAHETTRP